MNPSVELTIVAPVFNEEENIAVFHERVTKVCTDLQLTYEIVFVDDGSVDRSPVLIAEFCRRDPYVRGLCFSRNFGSHAALLAGLRNSRGRAAVILSVDLQDPPELIGEMLQRWRAGAHVVWGVRESRDDPWQKQLFARVFYRIMRQMALPNYPEKGMDFGLFDRKVIDALCEIREANQFIMGLILWLGFRQEYISYHREARRFGVSKWPFWKRLKSAIDAIVSFSYFPIRFISWMGLAVSLISVVYACILIVNRLVFGLGVAGWPSVMVALLFLGGVQLIMLGILGEYVWRGMDQTKGRPPYIIMEQWGCDNRNGETAPVNPEIKI